MYAQLAWQAGENLLQLAFDPVDDVEGRRLAVPQHRQKRRLASVLPHDVRLDSMTLPHLRHVTQVDQRAALRAKRKRIEPLDCCRTAVEPHEVFPAADLRGAGRQNQVLSGECIRYVACRQIIGIKCVRIEIHHDRRILASERKRNRSAFNGSELRTDEVLAQIVELLLRKRLAVERELQNRNARCVVLYDPRGKDPRRQWPQNRLRQRRDLGDRSFDLHTRLKKHTDRCHTLIRGRFDVLDIVDGGGHGAFIDGDDALGHLLWRHPAVRPDHAHHGDLDDGKDVLTRGDDGDNAQHEHQYRHHDDRVGSAQR